MADYVQSALRQMLLNDSTIFSHVSNRIFPWIAGQDYPLPVIVFQDITQEVDNTLQGQTDYNTILMSYRVISDSYEQTILVSNQVKRVFNIISGTYYGIRFGGIKVESIDGDYDSEIQIKGDPGLFSRIVLARVNFNES